MFPQLSLNKIRFKLRFKWINNMPHLLKVQMKREKNCIKNEGLNYKDSKRNYKSNYLIGVKHNTTHGIINSIKGRRAYIFHEAYSLGKQTQVHKGSRSTIL
ncbi:hypothetical protein V6Z11_D06G137600 [Gossypium hirsutum]